jgi:ribosomal protein S6
MTINQNSYRCILLLGEFSDKSELQLLAYKHAKFLKQLGAVSITAVIRDDFSLTYSIKKCFKVKFIEFSFLVSPKALNVYKQKLNLDETILRSFIIRSD